MSDKPELKLIQEAIAHLREEADFNRSWTDGRRGHPFTANEGYVARRLELANQAESWAAAIETLAFWAQQSKTVTDTASAYVQACENFLTAEMGRKYEALRVAVHDLNALNNRGGTEEARASLEPGSVSPVTSASRRERS